MKKTVKIRKNEGLSEIPGKKTVTLTQMGNINEIMYIENYNTKGLPITRLSKTEYVINATGEIMLYKNDSENRADNKDSLRKTFKKIRELINTNFTGQKNELCFTITYKENMTDTKRLYRDYQNFMDRLRYKYSNIDYISVVEPQGRGAWHMHVLLRFNDVEKIYIPNKEIEELWGKGFTKVKAIRSDVDNMGAYLSAYLGDVELKENNISQMVEEGILQVGQAFEIKEVEVQGEKKKFIKGGRLHLYPLGMNIYRKSEGILYPSKERMSYQEAKKIVGVGAPNYSTNVKIFNEQDESLNTIVYEQYNTKRSSLKEKSAV